LDDWRDAYWFVARGDNRAGHMSAFGRDVDVEEFGYRLDLGAPIARYDADLGNRQDARKSKRAEYDEHETDRLVATVLQQPGLNTNALTKLLAMDRSKVKRLADEAEAAGLICRSAGPNRSLLHFPGGAP
jgi:hypothetical protein